MPFGKTGLHSLTSVTFTPANGPDEEFNNNFVLSIILIDLVILLI